MTILPPQFDVTETGTLVSSPPDNVLKVFFKKKLFYLKSSYK